jgi:hypothetical protein
MKLTFEKYQEKVVEKLKEHRNLTVSNLRVQIVGGNFSTDLFNEKVILPLQEAGKV